MWASDAPCAAAVAQPTPTTPTHVVHHRPAVHIDAPIGLVWDVLQDPALRPCWGARVRSARALGPGPLGRGARIEVALVLGPLPFRAVKEQVTWRPPFHGSVRTAGHDPLGTRTTGSWRLREAPAGGTG